MNGRTLIRTTLVICFAACLPLLSHADDVVISHGKASITRAEFEAILQTTPKQVRSAAANNVGERFEFINSLMVMRKLAAEADEILRDDPRYWDLYFELVATKSGFIYEALKAEAESVDPLPLAREYYKTKKDKYALVGEKRASSHILLAAAPGLDRKEVRLKAQGLLDELRTGADWEAMVAEYSDDPGSAARGGSLARWVSFGDPGITPPYTEALFKIDQTGDYSEITDSQFGIHIIRLDGIEPAYYKDFNEVVGDIVKDVRAEQSLLAAREVRSRFYIDDDALIDGQAMEDLFAPYK